MEGKANLGETIADCGKGGSRRANIGVVITGRHAVNTTFRIVDMGDNPPHLEGPGGVPP